MDAGATAEQGETTTRQSGSADAAGVAWAAEHVRLQLVPPRDTPVVELENHSSVPLIGAPQAWGAFNKTGAGMRIAVIDTGVDYVHRGLGGSGSSAD